MICKAVKKDGKPCRYKCKYDKVYCGVHEKKTACISKNVNFIHNGEDSDCPICLESVLHKVVLNCNRCKYIFHSDCLMKALLNNDCCPCCRFDMKEFLNFDNFDKIQEILRNLNNMII